MSRCSQFRRRVDALGARRILLRIIPSHCCDGALSVHVHRVGHVGSAWQHGGLPKVAAAHADCVAEHEDEAAGGLHGCSNGTVIFFNSLSLNASRVEWRAGGFFLPSCIDNGGGMAASVRSFQFVAALGTRTHNGQPHVMWV